METIETRQAVSKDVFETAWHIYSNSVSGATHRCIYKPKAALILST